MGDGFDLVRRLTGGTEFGVLEEAAARVEAGSDGVIALDWFNGCRTPLMDGSLSGGFLGLKMSHTSAHVYRATLEATAFGLRWIVETLRNGDVPVTRFVATGGLAHASPLFMRIVASVLGEPVMIHAAEQGPALGAAILGALAAGSRGGGFDDVHEAVACMAGARSALGPARVVEPVAEWRGVYAGRYAAYRTLTEEMARPGSVVRGMGMHGE
jgi:L-ribulokinase